MCHQLPERTSDVMNVKRRGVDVMVCLKSSCEDGMHDEHARSALNPCGP